MDTATQSQRRQVDVSALINQIKANMPETYQAIQKKAAAEGNDVYALVRRGLRGEVNCFYAIERGHVMGTPFHMPDVQASLAMRIVSFGCTFLIMWGVPREGQG